MGSPRLRVAAGSLRLLLSLLSVGFPGSRGLRGLVVLPCGRSVLEGLRERRQGSVVGVSPGFLSSALAPGCFGGFPRLRCILAVFAAFSMLSTGITGSLERYAVRCSPSDFASETDPEDAW